MDDLVNGQKIAAYHYSESKTMLISTLFIARA